MKKVWPFIPFIAIGIADTVYLTYEKMSNYIPPCSTSITGLDCGKVLTSHYSSFLGVPVSVWGLIHYSVFLFWILLNMRHHMKYTFLLFIQALIGLLVSFLLVGLQLFVIHAICFYCMISALNSLILFILALSFIRKQPQLTFEHKVGYNE